MTTHVEEHPLFKRKGAELLGLGDETGTIECGKAADILVTRERWKPAPSARTRDK